MKLGRIRIQLVDFEFMKDETEEVRTELEKEGKDDVDLESESCP